MKICSFCGEEISDTADVCPWCGRVDPNLFPEEFIHQTQDPRTPKKIPRKSQKNKNSFSNLRKFITLKSKLLIISIIFLVIFIFLIPVLVRSLIIKDTFISKNFPTATNQIITIPPRNTQTLASTKSPMPTLTPTELPLATIIASYIEVWNTPDDTVNKLIGELHQNDEVEIIGKNISSEWIQVKSKEGEIGWIIADYEKIIINKLPYELPISFYRPLTGLMKLDPYLGYGELEIINNSSEDGIVVLQRDFQSFASVYIRENESYIIRGIQSGEYLIFFMLGHDWDGEKFNTVIASERFLEPFEFENTEIWYTVGEITLAPIVGGNATTIPIEEGEFPLDQNNIYW